MQYTSPTTSTWRHRLEIAALIAAIVAPIVTVIGYLIA